MVSNSFKFLMLSSQDADIGDEAAAVAGRWATALASRWGDKTSMKDSEEDS